MIKLILYSILVLFFLTSCGGPYLDDKKLAVSLFCSDPVLEDQPQIIIEDAERVEFNEGEHSIFPTCLNARNLLPNHFYSLYLVRADFLPVFCGDIQTDSNSQPTIILPGFSPKPLNCLQFCWDGYFNGE